MNLLGFIMSLVYMQAVHGRLSTYERLVNSQNFFSPYLTQEDISRLGRDYLGVGYYTDTFFPEHNIRFIAVNDCVDSDDGENELAPFRNVMNEIYARDISRCGLPIVSGAIPANRWASRPTATGKTR